MAESRPYTSYSPVVQRQQVVRQVVGPQSSTVVTTTVNPQSSYVTYSTAAPIVSQAENPLGSGPIIFTPPTWEFTNKAMELQGRASGIPRAVQIPTAPAFTPATKIVSQVGDVRPMNQKHPRAWVTTPVADPEAPYKLRPRGFSVSTYESTVGHSTDWDVKSRYLIALRSGPTECPDHILCKSRLFPKEEFTSPYVLYYFDETAPNDILLENDVIKGDKNHKKSSKGLCGMGSQKGTGDDLSQRTTSSDSRSSSVSSSSSSGPSGTVSMTQSSRNATMRSTSVTANRGPTYVSSRGPATTTSSVTSTQHSGYGSKPVAYKSADKPCCRGRQTTQSMTSSRYHNVQEENYVSGTSELMSKSDAGMREAYVKANFNNHLEGSSSSSSSYSSVTSGKNTSKVYTTGSAQQTHKHTCRGCGDSHFCSGARGGHSVEVQSRGVETFSSSSSVTSSASSSNFTSSATPSSQIEQIRSSHNGQKSRSSGASTTESSSYSSYRNPYAGRVSSYTASSADGSSVPMLMPPNKKDKDRNTTYTMRRLFVDVDDLRIPKNGSGLKMLPTYSVSYRNYPVLCYDVVAPSKYEDFFRVRKCPGFFN